MTNAHPYTSTGPACCRPRRQLRSFLPPCRYVYTKVQRPPLKVPASLKSTPHFSFVKPGKLSPAHEYSKKSAIPLGWPISRSYAHSAHCRDDKVRRYSLDYRSQKPIPRKHKLMALFLVRSLFANRAANTDHQASAQLAQGVCGERIYARRRKIHTFVEYIARPQCDHCRLRTALVLMRRLYRA